MDEEKRLCYVAMTRAKTELILTWRRETRQFTAEGVRTVKRERSRFLDILVGEKREKDELSKESSDGLTVPTTRKKAVNDEDILRLRKMAAQGQKQRTSQSGQNFSSRTRSYSTRAPQAPVTMSRPATKLEGTARVYGNRSYPARTPQSPVTLPRPVTKLEGTASVYGNRKSSPTDSVSRKSGSGAPDEVRSKPIHRKLDDRAVNSDTVQRPSSSEGPRRDFSKQLRQGTPTRQRAENDDRGVHTSSGQTSSSAEGSDAKRASLKQQRQEEPTRQHTVSKSSKPRPDSTWFYPIGSSVAHKSHGKGVVLPPPATDPNGESDMLVRVKFLNGQTLTFSALGADLIPTL